MAHKDWLDYGTIYTNVYPLVRGPIILHVMLKRPSIGCHPDATGLHLHIFIMPTDNNHVSWDTTICLGPHTAQNLSKQLAETVDDLIRQLVIDTLTS